MKKSTVRIFAMVLAALMVLSLLPLAYAHAEEFAFAEEMPVIPGFTWMGDHYEETEHIFGEIVNEDFLVNPEEPGDCVTPAVYWKSCVNLNPFTEERCGATAEAAWTEAFKRVQSELAGRRANGEKADFESIFVAAIADLDARYKFTAGGSGHTWVEHEHQEATCEQNGWDTYYQCAVCGEILDYGEIPVIEAKGHRWGEAEVVTPATCAEAGLAKYVCEVCGVEVTEEIPATGEHSFVDGVCTVCGAADESYVPETTVEEEKTVETETTVEEEKTDGTETTVEEEKTVETETTVEEEKTDGTEKQTEEENNEPAVYTGEVTITQQPASEEVVNSFVEAAWNKLGLTNENTAGISVQNVTPLKEDGSELQDEEIPEEGLTFEMEIPAGFDPANQEIEIYHYNKETEEWERMQVIEVKDNTVVVRKVRSFSPFGLIVKRLDDIAIVVKPISDTAALEAGPVEITFDANGGTLSGANPRTTDADGKITMPDKTECTRDGYTLVSWTEVGGRYLPGEEYTFTKKTTLTAIWAKNVKIIFDANAITAEGSMPPQDKDADGNPLYEGQYVQLNPNTYTNGDEVFKNWNTDKNAASSGTKYEDKDEVHLTDKDLTLYAQWTHTHTVTFKPGTEGSGTEQTQTFLEGTSKALTTIKDLGFTSTTADFVNWKDQDGKTYTDGQSIAPKKDLELTAQWDKKYTITFSKTYESATGEMDDQVIHQSELDKAGKVALDANAFKLEGYTFAYWTDVSGTKLYDDEEEIAPTGDMTLYAKWVPAITITFYPNYDTTTAPKTQEEPKDQDAVLDANTYTRISAGYLFKYWATKANGTGDRYEDKGTIPAEKMTEDIKLYAQWAGPVTIRGSSTGTGSTGYVGETLTATVANAKDVTGITYQWCYYNTTTSRWIPIAGATQRTFTPTAAYSGQRLACYAVKGDSQARSNEKDISSVLIGVEWAQDIINNGDLRNYPAATYYTQIGKISGVSAKMQYQLNGGSWTDIPTSRLSNGVMSVTVPGTYKFRIAGAESAAIVVYNWYTIGLSYSSSTTTSSTGTTTSASGRAVMNRVNNGTTGAMPSTPVLSASSATQREQNTIMKYSTAVDNVWVIKAGATTSVTLTVTPSSGSYAHVNLNGTNIASFGNPRTTTSSSSNNVSRTFQVNPYSGNPITRPMFYSVTFNNSSTSPRTADESRLGLWSAMCFASLASTATILTGLRKRKKNRG